ncbi:hypothetical protein BSKO_05333 [Bryopsis sp. KO-2023]|nr:hypothetical protein BSKO_05333 [Bryopsis sp. KO-2023]
MRSLFLSAGGPSLRPQQNCTRCVVVAADGKEPRAKRRPQPKFDKKSEPAVRGGKNFGVQNRERKKKDFKKGRDPRYRGKSKGNANVARVTGTFFSARSFERCDVNEEMQHALTEIGIDRPSHIQAMSLNAFQLHEDRNILIADHAGSGKTLAYLIPIVQRLKQKEKELAQRLTKPNNPQVIILVPTSELAAQVMGVCRSLSRTLPFRSVALTGGHPWKTQKDFLNEGVDVVVGTPARIRDHLKEGTLQLNECANVVMDEVDVLLGEAFDFRSMTLKLIESLTSSIQFVFVTATVPNAIYVDLQSLFSNLALVLGPGLHRSAPGVTEQLVDCSGGEEINEESGQRRKMAALMSLLQQHRVDRTVVFCNKIDTCRLVENFLLRNTTGLFVIPYHAAISEDNRKWAMKHFLRPKVDDDSEPIVLISTDRASRGLDTATVAHVILFDFPRDPSEYVRRVGRTARGATGGGLVSVLVLGRQVKLAQSIIDKNQKGVPIHEIPEPLS